MNNHRDLVLVSNRGNLQILIISWIIKTVKSSRKAFRLFDKLFLSFWTPRLFVHGVELYEITKRPTGYKETAPFRKMQSLLRQAINIKVLLGEMDHDLMERPDVIDGIKYALENNNAEMTFVHGPRIDPQTKTIYNYVNKYNVSFHRLYNYREHHFIIIKTKDGSTFAFDESTHIETYWGIDRNDRILPFETTEKKIYYLIPPKHHRISQLESAFDKRLRDSVKINGRPNQFTRQDYSFIELTEDLTKTFIIRYFLQLLSTKYDISIDAPRNFVLPLEKALFKITSNMKNEIEANHQLRVSEILSNDYVNLVSSLFYLQNHAEDTSGFTNFIKEELCLEPALITSSLLDAGLISEVTGLITLTNLGSEVAKKLYQVQ